MTCTEALLKGYATFYKKYFQEDSKLYDQLYTKGQAPKTLVIACSDSRVDPAILTSANPGDIFTVRNVANLVPPYEPTESGHHGVSAALEFAVTSLKVENIIVLGHSGCGGIMHLLNTHGKKDGSTFIGPWVDIVRNVCCDLPDGTEDEKQTYAEKNAIVHSLKNLLKFPWIKEAVEAGTLTLHGWYFDIQTGKLLAYDNAEHVFHNVQKMDTTK